MGLKTALLSIVAMSTLAATAPIAAAQESVEEFYSGRTIDLYIGVSPGGEIDQIARLVGAHLPRFLPGNPEIIPQNMPGGGTRTAANYLANVAPQDGTALGAVDQSLPLNQAMRDDTLDIDMSAFHFLGTPVVSNNVVVTWHTSGIESLEDAQQASEPIPMSSSGTTTTLQYPNVIRELFDVPFEVIVGYQGGAGMDMAMEQGETAGRGSNTWSSYRTLKPDWVADGLINVLVQVGLRPEPDLPDVPLLTDLAENDEDRAMLELLSAPVALGRSIIAPPGVPEDRVQALRDAFDAMVEDPEFIAAAEAQNIELSPVGGEELQAIVEQIVSAPEEVGARLLEMGGTLGQ